MTYFTNYYTALLARTVESVGSKLQTLDLFNRIKPELDPVKDSRLIKGAAWMAGEDVTSITSEKWKNKFGVSFETARKDLMKLEEAGFLRRMGKGHKIFFEINR